MNQKPIPEYISAFSNKGRNYIIRKDTNTTVQVEVDGRVVQKNLDLVALARYFAHSMEEGSK